MNASSYYSDLTSQYERYAGEAHGWHYGVWEGDVTSHAAALLRSNEVLLRGLEVNASTRILDVGFGVGGFAVWAASRLGAHITGITVSPDHIALARGLAHTRGVSSRCEFLAMDMDALDFPSGRFDVVVNQETFCHAADKPNYLAAVRRLLRPGGSWRAVDFSRQDEPLDARQQHSYREVCEGFHLPSMVPPSAATSMLQGAGFEDVECRDLSADVLKTAAQIERACYLPLFTARLGLDWTFRPGSERRRKNRRGHVEAAFHYSRGLQRGFFRHVYYSARTPLDRAVPPVSSKA